jgi:hypothetical protein
LCDSIENIFDNSDENRKNEFKNNFNLKDKNEIKEFTFGKKIKFLDNGDRNGIQKLTLEIKNIRNDISHLRLQEVLGIKKTPLKFFEEKIEILKKYKQSN